MRSRRLRILAGQTALLVALVAADAGTAGGEAAVKQCKPAIVMRAEIGKALSIAPVKIETQPASPQGVPAASGIKGKDFECDWGRLSSGHIGLNDGRASLLVFASDTHAGTWFTASVAREKPSCRTVAFADAACVQPGAFQPDRPRGARPGCVGAGSSSADPRPG